MISVPQSPEKERILKHTLSAIALGAFIALAPQANATVIAANFTADATDDMESYGGGRTAISTLFGGTVALSGSDPTASVNQGNWYDYRSSSLITPSSGSLFATIFGFGNILLDFTGLGGINGFSGFASAAGIGADQLDFYDLSGVLMSSSIAANGFGPGNGVMEFFSFISDTKIGSIVWSGPETAFDDLSYTTSVAAVPVPAAGFLLIGALGGLAALRRRKSLA